MTTGKEYSPDKLRAFCQALERSDIDSMRKLAAEVPDLFRKLHEQELPDWAVCNAAQESSPEAIQALLELGADVNEQDSNGDTGLCWAVMDGRQDAAKMLLESGADPNLNCPIFNVASQDIEDRIGMAALLLDHGANINQPFLVEGLPPRNVLSEAIARGRTELVDFLKSRGAKLPEEHVGNGERMGVRPEPDGEASEIIEHFREHYGEPVGQVVYQIVPSSDDPIEVHYIPVTIKGDSAVLFTTGLSRTELPVGEGAENYRRAELMLELGKAWPRAEEAMKDPRWSWPIRWMFRIADYAANSGNWLGAGFTTLVDEEPPKPLAPGLKFTAWLLDSLRTEATVVHSKDGTAIQIYQLFPLYDEEYHYAREHGTEALVSLFVERKIETYIDLDRPNVAVELRL